ncbi:MAG: membrane protein [Peptococcaceae bacterium BICA1-8]|nr:MAG: membrane protein [Peptococcaceae bacterium BICA1-8]
MTKKIVGIFSSKGQAEGAAEQLRQAGFDKEISIVSKGEEKKQGNKEGMNMGTSDSVTDGAATGATWGALGGLALGAGALAIPGFGPLLAAGPIAAALSGAAAGGLGGALVDMGIPETESKNYEKDVKMGKTLIAIECSDDKAAKAQEILKQSGAENVKQH